MLKTVFCYAILGAVALVKGQVLGQIHQVPTGTRLPANKNIKADTLEISPDEAKHHIGELVKIRAYVHHVKKAPGKVVLYINSNPVPEKAPLPIVMLKPLDFTHTIMTITFTGAALKDYERFSSDTIDLYGRLHLKNGYPNLNISKPEEFAFSIVVE
ncbi:hypothetical protein [Mucilaginibacter sp. CSA2-8R]|uniref:hypothetical protein n=1 Tax=Mucilaginibacter sp. CSA2-8R TaxID=3141542 RepID=UPI00315D5B94